MNCPATESNIAENAGSGTHSQKTGCTGGAGPAFFWKSRCGLVPTGEPWLSANGTFCNQGRMAAA